MTGLGLDALESTDWGALMHAYASAADTPGHLMSLVSPDDRARQIAIDHLDGAVLHQGTPYPATAPAARVVAGLLNDARLNAPAVQPELDAVGVRTQMIDWLADVIVASKPDQSLEELQEHARQWSETFSYDDDEIPARAMDAMYAQSVLACREVVPLIADPVLAHLDSPDEAVRSSAANAAGKLASTPILSDRRPQILDLLIRRAADAMSTDERSCLVLAIGEAGGDTGPFLADTSQAVRCCAALFLRDDPGATDQILKAVTEPSTIDAWFDRPPRQFEMRPRFTFVRAAIERSPEFKPLLPASIAIARITSKYLVDQEWGPLLVAAFGSEPLGDSLNDSQRAYLKALVRNRKLWDPKFGNAQLWFQRVDLPYDRKACLRIARSGKR